MSNQAQSELQDDFIEPVKAIPKLTESGHSNFQLQTYETEAANKTLETKNDNYELQSEPINTDHSSQPLARYGAGIHSVQPSGHQQTLGNETDVLNESRELAALSQHYNNQIGLEYASSEEENQEGKKSFAYNDFFMNIAIDDFEEDHKVQKQNQLPMLRSLSDEDNFQHAIVMTNVIDGKSGNNDKNFLLSPKGDLSDSKQHIALKVEPVDLTQNKEQVLDLANSQKKQQKLIGKEHLDNLDAQDSGTERTSNKAQSREPEPEPFNISRSLAPQSSTSEKINLRDLGSVAEEQKLQIADDKLKVSNNDSESSSEQSQDEEEEEEKKDETKNENQVEVIQKKKLQFKSDVQSEQSDSDKKKKKSQSESKSNSSSKSNSDSDYYSEDQEQAQEKLRERRQSELWKKLRRTSLFTKNTDANGQKKLDSQVSEAEGAASEESFGDDYAEDETKWVIMPDGKFKLFWNFVIIFFMVYVSSIMPYRICFIDSYSASYYYFELVMTIVFGIDVLISFFSAYYDDDNILVTNNKYIAMQYLKGWFIIDVVSLIPFNNILPSSSGDGETSHLADTYSNSTLITGGSTSSNSGQYNELVRLARLPRLYRLVRLFRLMKLAKFQRSSKGGMNSILSYFFRLNASIKRMFKTMGLSVLAIHLAACFYFLIAKIDGMSYGGSWVNFVGLAHAPPYEQYIRAVDWATQTLTTVGFGDVPAQTNSEKIFAIIWMAVGGAFFSFMISNLQGVADDSNDNSIKTKLNRLLVVQGDLKLPDGLVLQIKRQLDFANKELQHHHLVQSAEFIDQLPTTLRAHVLLCVYANILNKVPFFVGKDIELIMKYIPTLNALYQSEGDTLYQQGDHPQEIYFLYHGCIQISDDKGRVVGTYADQDMIGVLEVIANISRIATAVAVQKSYIFSMSQADFIAMISEFQEIQKEVEILYHDAKDLYLPFMVEEDQIVTNLKFEMLIAEWQERQRMRGDMDLSLKKYNVDHQQTLNFHQHQIDVDDDLASIQKQEEDFDEEQILSFKTEEDVELFLQDLALHYGKDFGNVIDDLLGETNKLKRTLKMKNEYYSKKKQKLSELLQILEQIKDMQA